MSESHQTSSGNTSPQLPPAGSPPQWYRRGQTIIGSLLALVPQVLALCGFTVEDTDLQLLGQSLAGILGFALVLRDRRAAKREQDGNDGGDGPASGSSPLVVAALLVLTLGLAGCRVALAYAFRDGSIASVALFDDAPLESTQLVPRFCPLNPADEIELPLPTKAGLHK